MMKRLFVTNVLFALLTAGFVSAQDQTGTAPPPLAQQVGFSDATLSQLEAAGQNVLGDDVQFQTYGHSYRLFTVLQPVPGVPSDVPASIAGGSALLYQTDTATPTLVWSQDYLKLLGQAPYLTHQKMDFFKAPPPSDWNSDGQIEFAVLGNFAGTAWFSTFYYVYQLHDDNSVASVLKGGIPPGFIVYQIEPQTDGAVLFTAADIRGEMAMGLPNCCGPTSTHYFEWRGGQISDISAQQADRYVDKIGTDVFGAITDDFGDNPAQLAGELMNILSDYDAIGHRDAGWQLVQQIVAQAKSSGRLADGTYVDTTFMPAEQQLYQSGQPFVPPDYVGPNASAPQDFYAEIPMGT
jgi:hypothetical protein